MPKLVRVLHLGVEVEIDCIQLYRIQDCCMVVVQAQHESCQTQQ